jgi:hypothetical protein
MKKLMLQDHFRNFTVTVTLFAVTDSHRAIYWMIWFDWLINYLRFYVRSRIFHLYGIITITGKGLQNLGLISTLRAFEQGGIFIVSHLLWHGTSVFLVSSEGPPHSVASCDTQADVENLFFSRLLRHASGCWGHILTRIPTILNDLFHTLW